MKGALDTVGLKNATYLRMTPADPRPSIDERLERLAQTVKSLAASRRDNESGFAAGENRLAQVARDFEIVLDSLKHLEQRALSHGKRIDHLET